MKNTLHINFYSGPGCGKSTIAAQLFSILKWNKIDCELVSEYAKQITWEESYKKLNNQIYLFAKQLYKHKILEGKVDVIITDSPLPLNCIYDADRTKHLKDLVFSEFNKFNNLNFLLTREKDYNPNGRNQTKEQAILIDAQVKELLDDNYIIYDTLPGNANTAELIFEKIKQII